MKRGDIVIISIVLVIALAFAGMQWLTRDGDIGEGDLKVAHITVDGQPFRTVKLTKEEQTIEINTDHGTNILKIHDYGVEMYEADCPDQICLGFGFITMPKQTIVCLPHRVLVEIAGSAGEDVIDGIVQ